MQDQTPIEQAEHIRVKLLEELQTLKLFEEELKGHPVQGFRKRVRLDRVSAAIGHLQQVIDDLKLAIGE